MSISYRKKDGTLSDVLLAGTPKTDLILDGTSSNAIANRTVYNALAQKIEATVENLVNFYNKSQVFNKQEVRELIGAINTLTIEVVNSLPTSDISATTIYFLKQSGANAYDEYIYVDNAWVKIGDTEIDLSGYMTTANFNIAIADYYNKTAIDTMIANYYTKTEVENLLENVEIDVDDTLSTASENPVQNKIITNALNDKQDTIFVGTTAEWNTVSDKSKYTLVTLTDDADYVGNIVDAVTNGEMSAVTSNAVYDALLGKLDSSKIKYGISSNAVDTTGSITFDTAFADANYIVFICPINPNDAIAWSSSVISKTASGFVFETKYQNTDSARWISYYRGIGWLAIHL